MTGVPASLDLGALRQAYRHRILTPAALVEDLIARGMRAGYADEHLTALIKVLRAGQAS